MILTMSNAGIEGDDHKVEALVKLFPGRKQTFDDAFFQGVNAFPQAKALAEGVDLGQRVAEVEFTATIATPHHASLLKDLTAFATPDLAPADVMPGITRSFMSLNAAANVAGPSRICGGIHDSFDNVDGSALGMRIGRYVVHHAFRGRAPH